MRTLISRARAGAVIVALLCVWSAAAAQQVERVLLDDVAFRAAFEGRTMHVRDARSGAHYGSEEFFAGDVTTWIADGDTCREGYWRYTADRQFCFDYGDGVDHCWFVYQEGDDVYVESAAGLLLLEVYLVDDEDLGCAPPVS